MAFVAFTTAEVDADSPLTETFFTKMKDNFDALDASDVTNGDAHDHESGDGGLIPQGGFKPYIAGTNILALSAAAKDTIATSYTKMKEIIICRTGALRVYFTLSKPDTGTAFGKVYKNGSPVGTERSSSGTFNEDFSSLAIGDKIQIYAYNNAADIARISNFSIRCSFATNEEVILD